ncbi:MAG TPA: inositol monophosphatase [Chromatiaceae bacterium]|jgi:myo-inositol-1(or 4)-monophosphatase|nr:inositol monophosphatase [Chromatiaceae bacterium]HIB84910.1 inositol monophosphatase [Chromatiaceae bacterium]HIN82730.1 inositol monophosphatase [Chromatiales bacterium]HIO14943.1 inositol monophosphatase [Chromatiales bacterium]HIO54763.1 inositol monophosphatase [Chromatiales bacterium]
METPEITELLDIVRRATQQELLPRFGKIQRDYKSDRSIVTEADLAMQHGIRLELASRWDGFPMLGEEMPLQAQQALITNSTDGLWVVDPIDGTSNFAAGIPYWAVSVAWFHGGVAKLGLVYDPVRDEAFSAGLGQGARLNGQLIEPSLSPEQLSQTIAAIDFKRLPPALATRLVQDNPYSSQRSFGSVALDWCWLAANRFHIYLHGKQNIWDYAAGNLIFSEAGGYATTLEGDLVPIASVEPRSAMGALDYELFKQWSNYLRG